MAISKTLNEGAVDYTDWVDIMDTLPSVSVMGKYIVHASGKCKITVQKINNLYDVSPIENVKDYIVDSDRVYHTDIFSFDRRYYRLKVESLSEDHSISFTANFLTSQEIKEHVFEEPTKVELISIEEKIITVDSLLFMSTYDSTLDGVLSNGQKVSIPFVLSSMDQEVLTSTYYQNIDTVLDFKPILLLTSSITIKETLKPKISYKFLNRRG